MTSRPRPGHPWSRDPDPPAGPGTSKTPGRPFPATPESPAPTPQPHPLPAKDEAAPEPCADLRAAATVACTQAAALRATMEAVRARHTLAQREYDDHVARRDAAAVAADPRAVRTEKDAAQARFRKARNAASDRASAGAAATAWLDEINAINRRTRDAAVLLARETADARRLLAVLEKVGAEADGARLSAARADDACRTARQALAACEERSPAASSGVPAADPGGPRMESPPPAVAPPTPPTPPTPASTAHSATSRASTTRASSTPLAIDRLVRGDHATMAALVAALAGADAEARGRWQMLLSDLVDAIVARAIDGAFLEFPEHHVLWGAVPPGERRSVAAALAALGCRFDGMGGFADGRIPTQRELSMAVGEAGIGRARIRPWPADPDLPLLYRNVRVDAVGFLASEAGGLTLDEMIGALGRRAESLAALWDAWGRLRPLLADSSNPG